MGEKSTNIESLVYQRLSVTKCHVIIIINNMVSFLEPIRCILEHLVHSRILCYYAFQKGRQPLWQASRLVTLHTLQYYAFRSLPTWLPNSPPSLVRRTHSSDAVCGEVSLHEVRQTKGVYYKLGSRSLPANLQKHS